MGEVGVSKVYIERVIQDLLLEQECVIVPDFGGFVSSYKPASVEASKKIILPPSRQLSFNSQLKRNDGLLAQAICERCGLDYTDALKSINARVEFWAEVLEEHNFLELDQIGSFIKNSEGNLVFEQFNESNYLPGAFGLSLIHAQPIEREGIVKRLEKEISNKPASKKKLRRTLVRAAAIALLITGSTFGVYQYGGKVGNTVAGLDFGSYIEKVKEHLPFGSTGVAETDTLEEEGIVIKDHKDFFDNESNKLFEDYGHTGEENLERIAEIQEQKGIDSTPIRNILKKEAEAKKALESNQLKQGAKKSVTETNVVEEPIVEVVTTSIGSYNVIAGCFRSKWNAKKMVRQLKKLGYEAVIAGKTSKGLHRVCYGSYNNEVQALKMLAKAKLNHNPNAWLAKD